MSDVYYDQYSVEINADPYPVYRRLREEAPVYYNDTYDFFAVSRYEDVEKGLLDAQTYSSGKGAVLEVIKARIDIPPGVVIFEDPPTHTIHRRLLSRAFTPRRVAELDTQQLMDVVFTVGAYEVFAMALRTFDVELDEDLEPYA